MTTPSRSLDDHLHESQHGSVDADLKRNYDEVSSCSARNGAIRRHDGMRQLAERPGKELPDATSTYRTIVILMMSASSSGRQPTQPEPCATPLTPTSCATAASSTRRSTRRSKRDGRQGVPAILSTTHRWNGSCGSWRGRRFLPRMHASTTRRR